MISQMSGAHLGIFQRYDPIYPTSQIVSTSKKLACENIRQLIRFSSLFAAGAVSSEGNEKRPQRRRARRNGCFRRLEKNMQFTFLSMW